MMKNLKLLVQHSAYTLFFNLKKGNVALLGLSKEKVIWTSFSHLNVWYDAWENFLTTYGFASEITHESGEKEVLFTQQQKHILMRQICLLTDPMVAMGVIKHWNQPGTAKNKTSLSSSSMCGSNAAGESMSLHIMFTLITPWKKIMQLMPCACSIV